MATVVDIEATNRCNAKCHFCPRDRTPHEGLMSAEIFARTLGRAVEFRRRVADFPDPDVTISLCGLGEPLLNRRLADYVRMCRAEGFKVTTSSNGSLLDERRATELLDAGLQQICINVGEEGEDYEEIYKLPFERTLDNVVRFNEMAKGRCEVMMVVVDHRDDAVHVDHMRSFWRERGIDRIISYQVMNRGGSLFVDHMQYEALPELATARAMLDRELGGGMCAAPFLYLFVGYDGQYYLCCSDWEKQTALGSVFDRSFEDVVGPKLAHLSSREPVCRTCNLDPINRLTEALNADADGENHDELLESITNETSVVRFMADAFGHQLGSTSTAPARRLIPLLSE